ncbi:MAG: transposase [Candidatus Korobacteraceae bacterium]|jgi:hypothetical protein
MAGSAPSRQGTASAVPSRRGSEMGFSPWAFNLRKYKEEYWSGLLAIKHRSGIYVEGDIHTNTVENAFCLLKRGTIGTWHRISAKHLAAYLAEMEFRFNRRKNPDLFIDTLRQMVTADPLTFERSIASC